MDNLVESQDLPRELLRAKRGDEAEEDVPVRHEPFPSRGVVKAG